MRASQVQHHMMNGGNPAQIAQLNQMYLNQGIDVNDPSYALAASLQAQEVNEARQVEEQRRIEKQI